MQVAILGGGGNMGMRISRTLQHRTEYTLRLIEPGEAGRVRIETLGLTAVDQETGLAGADVVIFAVPDKIVRQVAADVVPLLDSGTNMLFLDPAAVAAGRVPRRDDIACFVMHPTHPPLYSLLAEESAAARKDFWGGGQATQAIVFAVAWGEEDQASRVEELARDMFFPVSASYRITVDQMALLEPALTETLTNGCIAIIREGMERVVAAGAPEATRQFLTGHLQIGIALIFEQLDWQLSHGAKLALQQSREQLFKDDWYRIFEPESVMGSLEMITRGD